MMIIIGGATATGKSALAARLASHIGGELVSADSMQIYRGMDIGTAKDTECNVTLNMIDVVSPNKPFTVVDYRAMATEVIRDISSRGKDSIVVGGTGLYIDSLLYNMEYGGSGKSDPELMEKLRAELSERGAEYMHAKLKELDPVTASKVHFNNTVRVLRALYVALDTGKPISAQKAELDPIEPFKLFVLTEDRAVLRERIAVRVDRMLEAGLESEVRRLIGSGCDFTMQSMQAIGYKEWADYLEGKCTLGEVREKIIANTRAYAKRQETWFNNRYKAIAVKISAAEFRADPDKVLELIGNTPYITGNTRT